MEAARLPRPDRRPVMPIKGLQGRISSIMPALRSLMASEQYRRNEHHHRRTGEAN
ncbi:MAG: hypothetical protein ACRYFR_04770 [Janthinobacterium lividum]